MGIASELFKLLARGAIYEKLIFNKEKENMHDFDVIDGVVFPREARKVDARREIQRLHDTPGEGVCVASSVPGGVYCDEVKCRDCIFCLNCGSNALAKKKAFMEYKLRYPLKGCANPAPVDAMPELKPGMIIHASKGHYYLVVVRREEDVVAHRCRLEFGSLFVSEAVSFQADDPDIDAVYEEKDTHWFFPAVIVDILRGSERHRIWKRKAPPKEMTVDEISKALGYKVKVVGSEKADD